MLVKVRHKAAAIFQNYFLVKTVTQLVIHHKLVDNSAKQKTRNWIREHCGIANAKEKT